MTTLTYIDTLGVLRIRTYRHWQAADDARKILALRGIYAELRFRG